MVGLMPTWAHLLKTGLAEEYEARLSCRVCQFLWNMSAWSLKFAVAEDWILNAERRPDLLTSGTYHLTCAESNCQNGCGCMMFVAWPQRRTLFWPQAISGNPPSKISSQDRCQRVGTHTLFLMFSLGFLASLDGAPAVESFGKLVAQFFSRTLWAAKVSSFKQSSEAQPLGFGQG